LVNLQEDSVRAANETVRCPDNSEVDFETLLKKALNKNPIKGANNKIEVKLVV
jgi:hypothetical protein